ncbi:MAG: molybdopterin-dependent oxidoreductase, partial [Candidatus Aminicenantes bacterium]|nr:molybdopterin-dependent oxidoreductase [Candidatus Aminicenantes bacterium]
DPLADRADGRLLTAERGANARGAADIGFAGTELSLRTWAGGTDLLLVFGSHILDHGSREEIGDALAKIPFKVLFAAHRTPLDRLMDVIVPVSLAAEKEGALTNVDGRVQSFQPVWPAAGDSLAESAVFGRLREELG